MTFEGFPNGLGLLDELPSLSKEQFAERREEWDKQILGPLRALVSDLGVRLQSDISPLIAAEPKVNGSISPINRDLRFARDRSSIYKDHVMLNFWEGPSKKFAPTLRLRIWSGGVGVATGVAFSPDGLAKWRAALAGERAQNLLRAPETLDRERKVSFSKPELKNPPKGFDAEHPSADLARHKSFQVRILDTVPASVTTPMFLGWCGDRMVDLGPIHRWLVDETV